MRPSDVVFFLTGAAALVYQTVWIRLFTRVLGSDAGALALVLAIFMGGMGLGSLLAGGLARRVSRPVLLFALLELALGAWAAYSPAVLIGLADGGEGAATSALLFLLPPTIAMGATFPLMARLSIRSREQTGSETSAFYGSNTLGAAAGALLGPLVLMPWLGLSGAIYAAALLDLVAAVLALLVLGAEPPVERERAAPGARLAAWLDPYLAASFLLGALGLGLEVTLARLLVSLTGASVYAYAIVLAVFLAGIGLGSRQLAQRAAPGGPPPRLRASGRTFFHAAALLPLACLAGLLALRWQLGERDLFGSLSNRIPGGAALWRLWTWQALLAALALLPAAIALGIALPSSAAALVERAPTIARERSLARLYALNTAGALLGAWSAGFVLLPRWGIRGTLLALLALAPLAAAIAPARDLRRLGLALAGSLVLCALLLAPRDRSAREATTVALHLDAHATAAVEDAPAPGGETVRSLRINGKVVASSAPIDLRLQRLLALVPAILHGEVESALVIGLGTGMTAGALLDLPRLGHLEVYEISPAVAQAARSFEPWNGAVLDDRRTSLTIADGRHALAGSVELYDLVTSDPIHPWTRGSSDLYSLEHFRRMERHLALDGVASQWLPLYQLSLADVRTVIATWCATFAHCSAWLTGYDLALVGAREPLPNEGRLAELEIPGAVGQRLAEAGVRSGLELAALQVAGDAELRAFAAGVAPMRDDRPVLEFRAPLSYLAGYSVEALRWAGRAEFVESIAPPARERARELRSLLARFLDELPEGQSAAAQRYGAALLALPPAPRRE